MKKITVIKVGGRVLDEDQVMHRFLDDLASIEGPVVLVHGGGSDATSLAKRLGIETKMVDGRRITDAAMLEVVVMSFAGATNSRTTALLQSRGVNACGFSGVDGDLIRAEKRDPHPVDFGWVGDITRVNAVFLLQQLDLGVTPVIASLCHDGKGNMLNTNADTVAAAVATALSEHAEVHLIYCLDRAGVEVDGESLTSLTRTEYDELKEQGIVSGGMLPKLHTAFSALEDGVKEVHLTRFDQLGKYNTGTTLYNA